MPIPNLMELYRTYMSKASCVYASEVSSKLQTTNASFVLMGSSRLQKINFNVKSVPKTRFARMDTILY